MLMSHSLKAHNVRIVYTVRMVIGAKLKRVKPLWLRANGCSTHPSYDIEGDQPPGAVHTKQSLWRMPLSGRHRRGERAPARQLVRPEGHAAALRGPPAHRPEAAVRLRRRHRLSRQADPPRAGADRHRPVPVEGRHPGAQGRDAEGDGLLRRLAAASARHGDHARLHRARPRRAARMQAAAQGRPHLLDAQGRPHASRPSSTCRSTACATARSSRSTGRSAPSGS